MLMRDIKFLNRLLLCLGRKIADPKINLYIYEISMKISTRFFFRTKSTDPKFDMENSKIKNSQGQVLPNVIISSHSN